MCVVKRLCDAEGCHRLFIFITPDKLQVRCRKHKADGMVPAKNKWFCKSSGCERAPLYNLPGRSHRIYCSKHREDGMVNVQSCLAPGCSKAPSYNAPGRMSGTYCAKHRSTGMVNVLVSTPAPARHETSKIGAKASHASCAHPDCGAPPTHAPLEGERPLFCEPHRPCG